MKKLLIVQLDESYFLFETIQVLENNCQQLKDFELTLLVNEESYRKAYATNVPLIKGITFRPEDVLDQSFDLSVNLSLREEAWEIQDKVSALKKLGPQRKENTLCVPDLWSTFLLTIKNSTAFLTFHLQQIYCCILGLHHSRMSPRAEKTVTKIAYGASSTSMFSSADQENFITGITSLYPGVPLVDMSEIDLLEDLSQILYIGPPTFEAVTLIENGGSGIFLTSHFQGFNLLPSKAGCFLISSEGKAFCSKKLQGILRDLKRTRNSPDACYPVYEIEEGNFNGPYLRAHGKSDLNYPFYQSHVVLWNFLLNLCDVELKISSCSDEQLRLLETHFQVVSKFLQLHDYALRSVDKIYHMSRGNDLLVDEFKHQLNTLSEVDQIANHLSSSHSFLRPLFDFYRLRKGQGSMTNLSEEAQSSYLIYSEEHQALTALKELFFVTLKKNEVNI